jgi:hypothetical protein
MYKIKRNFQLKNDITAKNIEQENNQIIIDELRNEVQRYIKYKGEAQEEILSLTVNIYDFLKNEKPESLN